MFLSLPNDYLVCTARNIFHQTHKWEVTVKYQPLPSATQIHALSWKSHRKKRIKATRLDDHVSDQIAVFIKTNLYRKKRVRQTLR